MGQYSYTAMLIIAMILLYFAYQQYNKTATILASGTKTKAKAIDLIAVRGDYGYTYKPVYEYTNKRMAKKFGENIKYNLL